MDLDSWAMARVVDDAEALQQLLRESRVDERTRAHVISRGYRTIALLGFAIPENGLEDFVKYLTPLEGEEAFQPYAPQVARLRRALTRCLEAFFESIQLQKVQTI